MSGLPNGVYVVDAERRVLFWNKGAEEITGYLDQEVLGRRCQDDLLVHCDENYTPLCDHRCPLRETMDDGKPREAKVYLRHKEGHRVPVRIRSVPVRDADGGIIGAAETFDECQDIPPLPAYIGAQAVRNHLDTHTGVPDPASTRRLLEACLRDYQEHRIPFGILIVAIDDLGAFGAKYGREAVFKMLHTVATTLGKSLRVGDTVGDWTESRFLALVLNCGAETLAHVNFVLKRVAGLAEILWWGERHSITVSVGGAVVRADDTIDSLLTRAENALAGTARNGGNGGDSVLVGIER